MKVKYFPDYDDTLPKIAGFVDSSYGNDTCPSIYSESLGLLIYCDYKDETKRESCGLRYGVTLEDNGDNLLATDSLAEVLAFVAQYNGAPEKCRNGKPFNTCTCC
jgi:hypothetical protein